MRRFSIALISAVSVIALTQIASAADMPVKAPVAPVAPVGIPYNWTGFYVVVICGAGLALKRMAR